MKRGTSLGLLVGGLMIASQSLAAPMIVVEARGAGLRPGMRLDSAATINLKDGERVTLIGADGQAVTLRGTYAGVLTKAGGASQNPRLALAALISTRNDRASKVGAIRSGANAAPLPDPWLIDVSRSGARCIREGQRPIWWRPDGSGETKFTVYPIDRSWRADFVWQKGQTQMAAPDLAQRFGRAAADGAEPTDVVLARLLGILGRKLFGALTFALLLGKVPITDARDVALV
jgi:hypothetical protein